MALALLVILACGLALSPAVRGRATKRYAQSRQHRRARKRATFIGEYCADIARRLHAGQTLLHSMTALCASAPRAKNPRRLEEPEIVAVLGAPIEQLRNEHAHGVMLARATQRWAERDGTDEMVLLSTAVRLSTQQMGADPALFDHVARTIGSRQDLIQEAQVQIAQARLSVWVVAALPWAIAAVLISEGGQATEVLLRTPLGWICIGLALSLELIGVGWMRWLIRRALP